MKHQVLMRALWSPTPRSQESLYQPTNTGPALSGDIYEVKQLGTLANVCEVAEGFRPTYY